MRGSVVKRGAGYSVKIELDRHPVTGKRQQKWHSGYRTKKEAEKARVDLLAKLDDGVYVEPARQTLADFLIEWMDARRAGLKPTTEAAYTDVIRAHIIPRIGNVPLQKVDGASSTASTPTCSGRGAVMVAAGSPRRRSGTSTGSSTRRSTTRSGGSG